MASSDPREWPRLSQARAGRLETSKSGWWVRGEDGALVATIETRGEPPSLTLRCADGGWRVTLDKRRNAFVAKPSGKESYGASMHGSTVGADVTVRREPDGATVKLDRRRLPRRRWLLGDATIVRASDSDGDALLRFTGTADPLLLMLALWHVALAEGDDPNGRTGLKSRSPERAPDSSPSYTCAAGF